MILVMHKIFRELKYSLKICVVQKLYFLWEFRADTLHGFEHTYKVSA